VLTVGAEGDGGGLATCGRRYGGAPRSTPTHQVLVRAVPAQTEMSSSTRRGGTESWKEQLDEPPLRDRALPPTCQGMAADKASNEETLKRCGTWLG
jgi:hypothetical protein